MPPVRDRRRAFAAVTLIAAAVTLFTVVVPAARAGGNGGCSSDQVMVEPGRTHVTTQSKTRFGHTNKDWGGPDLGGGVLSWNLDAEITGLNTTNSNGGLLGFLNVTINWDDPSLPNTTFYSFCVLSVGTDVGFLHEAEYLGPVHNFPQQQAARVARGDAIGAVPQGTTTGDPVGQVSLELERVRPSVAALDFEISFSECTVDDPALTINKDEANAPGHKTGNGTRTVAGCEG